MAASNLLHRLFRGTSVNRSTLWRISTSWFIRLSCHWSGGWRGLFGVKIVVGCIVFAMYLLRCLFRRWLLVLCMQHITGDMSWQQTQGKLHVLVVVRYHNLKVSVFSLSARRHDELILRYPSAASIPCYLSIRPCVHPFVCPFIRLPVRSFVRLSIHSSVRPFILLSVRPLICS